ncbi:site-specific recombinase domain protein [Bacteroides fragilis str. S36L5]|nr:site-specific recombinase domain protein [Bacteroides fragilis str. S36L5]
MINSKYKDLQTTKVHINLSANQRVTGSRKEKRREFFNFLRFSTQTRI